MSANIGRDELQLLTDIHEHVKGYGKRFLMNPQEIMERLGMGLEDFCRSASYLEEHGLVGLETFETTCTDSSELYEFVLRAVYLTGFGEDYMRELEKQPGIARRLTVTALKEIRHVVMDTAVKVLTQQIVRGV